MAEILPRRRKTLSNQSINQSRVIDELFDFHLYSYILRNDWIAEPNAF